MESEFFLNAGMNPVPPLPLHFNPTSSNSPPMPAWRSLPHSSSAMDMSNANYEQPPPPDCFFGNPNWDRSTDHHTGGLQYESALSSMVSSPTASNSNIPTESFMIRELIGKLGNIGGHGSNNPGEISPHLAAASSYGGSASNSCYSTPLSSPPKLSLPRMDQFVKTMGLNSSVAEFSADPGFAERAARFSCFGSRSFNGRTVQMSGGGGGGLNALPAMNGSLGGGKLPRVSSSPSLKALGSQKGNKGSPPPRQDGGELGNSSASPEESSLSEQRIPNAAGDGSGKAAAAAANEPNPRKRKAAPKGKAKESAAARPNASTAKEVETNENPTAKRSKGNGNNESKSPAKAAEEDAEAAGNSGGGEEKHSKGNNNESKPVEPMKDYIHVRARRGQATDSHSLAERVRREKISERMKLLQDLVPGCNKVTGKALMLDEIINYVQSLQRQVEFLSMKLSSVNTTRLDFSIDPLSSKDMYQRNNSGMAHPMFPVDSSASAILGHHHQNHHGSNSNSSISHCPLDPFALHHDQFQSFCDDDLQSIVQMGFSGNGPDADYNSGSSPNHQPSSSHMKVEI
ncbi:unnamed protein product [Linum tenue]|uniref:BHLH domain-containing protein n=2 Tax=Linum tenue TaxID=586396 RepID=A0AAV0KW04_9ROSI|nr:unnamed protein product [Linum tenue]